MNNQKTVLGISFFYLIFGVLWILVTDRLIGYWAPATDQILFWQTVKGWLFVALSTLLIFVLLRRASQRYELVQTAVSASETTYRLLFENNPLPMWVYDLETLAFLAVNDTAVFTYGYTQEEFAAMTIADIRPVEDVPRLMDDVAATTNRLNWAGEWRHRRRDGSVFPVEIISHTLTYNGRAARLVIANNLTERKEAEHKLRESEARFRRLAENAPDLIYRYNYRPSPHFEYVSPAATVITGYTPQEHYDDPELGLKLIHPDDQHLLADLPQEQMDGQALTLRWIRKDGEIRWTEQRNVAVRDESGELVAIEGIARDVTSQMQAEAQLRASEKNFRTAVTEAPVPIIIHAEDGEVLSISQTWTQITGYTLADIPTIRDWTKLAYAERAGTVENIIQNLYSLDQRVSEGEFLITCANGAQRIWDFYSTPLGALPDGRRTVISIATDVTERKQSEQALREKSEELDGYFRNALDLLCIADTNGVFRRLNRQWEFTMGYAPSDLEGQSLLSLVHPADVNQTQEAINQLTGQQTAVNFVNRYRHVDGTYRWIEWRTSTAGDLIYAAARDMTERIRTEEQLRLQSAALEAAANAILIVDINGKIEWFNPAFSFLTGYTLDEAKGHTPGELVRSGKQTREFYRELWETILNGRIWRGELINRRKNGRFYHEEMSITPVRGGQQGDITHFVAIKQDISERKRVEAERETLLAQMQAQAEQLSQLMTSVPVGVVLLDGNQQILVANPLAKTLVNWPDAAEQPHTLASLGIAELVEMLAAPGKPSTLEVVVNGRSLVINTRPIGAGPLSEGWVMVIRDVTDERIVARQLQHQERLAAIGQLAAGIAHDFNNIMAVIILYAQLLETELPLDTAYQSRLNIITRQADRASRLIQQILDFSRRSVLEQHPVDLLPLIKEEVKLLQRILPEHIEVTLTHSGSEFFINADPTRIEQTLMNLAVNARDAMPEGGRLQIELSHFHLSAADGAPSPGMLAGVWVRLSVKDNGTGMSPDALTHLFEPFYTTKEPGTGTGLGLAQVHGIVGQHGGYIVVDSELEKGTTFTIYLPALMLDNKSSIEEDGIDILPEGHGELVLVVEDEEALRSALVESLNLWQYRTLEAGNGQEALALLAVHHAEVAVILSDVIMPQMGGEALVVALAERAWDIPIILMTGHPLAADAEQLRASGVRIVLKKPLRASLLAKAVAAAVLS